jgi:hypothetical protein
MRGRGRGGYQPRQPYNDEEGMFRNDQESAITDTANFGGNQPYNSHYGDNQGTVFLMRTLHETVH